MTEPYLSKQDRIAALPLAPQAILYMEAVAIHCSAPLVELICMLLKRSATEVPREMLTQEDCERDLLRSMRLVADLRRTQTTESEKKE